MFFDIKDVSSLPFEFFGKSHPKCQGQTKISGQFKILNAAKNFAILRSIIDTAIKNNQNVFGALSVIAAYKRN